MTGGLAAGIVADGWRPPWLEMYSQARVPLVLAPTMQYAVPAVL